LKASSSCLLQHRGNLSLAKFSVPGWAIKPPLFFKAWMPSPVLPQCIHPIMGPTCLLLDIDALLRTGTLVLQISRDTPQEAGQNKLPFPSMWPRRMLPRTCRSRVMHTQLRRDMPIPRRSSSTNSSVISGRCPARESPDRSARADQDVLHTRINNVVTEQKVWRPKEG
jgi:hypothetical protein